MNIQVDGQTQT
jgi:hypothetical protein